ncbi:translation initiation factor IF-2 subunit alpha [Candidatus Woesearchaeota archaeon CG10_big_fil_rev_8_21_14_0_10_34_8]|nr:MAG: translation initiation factor IF-2 subunit alpha [Candidatus Woesearchaeota archaeon CG10_big_fil_rev_8_21_14_0_10_34_8]
MFYQRKDFPNERELVLCTVTKVQHHSVFVKLEEFNRSGMIHISEVSPGRIRNIRDFVKEGKVVVCQVLRINQERGYIDLSLRRVNDNQRRKKVDQLKQEQKAEKIIEFVAKELKKKPEAVYEEIFGIVSKHYPFLHLLFQDIVKDEMTLEEVGIPAEYQKLLEEVIRQRIKPQEVFVGGKLAVRSYAPDGIEIIKNALQKGIDAGKEQVKLRYLGGGSFNLVVKSEDYKDAEKVLKDILEAVEKEVPKGKGVVEFIREEKKAATV